MRILACPRRRMTICQSNPLPKPSTVAQAEPATPRDGSGPQPKMSTGSSTTVTAVARNSTRMARWASPAPRSRELITKTRTRVNNPPKVMRRNEMPSGNTCSSAPSKASSGRASSKPGIAMAIVTMMPNKIVCQTACEAASWSSSPMRRATTAIPPIPNPLDILLNTQRMVILMVTAASAAEPNFPTQ